MWETWCQSLSWEDSLEKGTATHSSILGQATNHWVTKSQTCLSYFRFHYKIWSLKYLSSKYFAYIYSLNLHIKQRALFFFFFNCTHLTELRLNEEVLSNLPKVPECLCGKTWLESIFNFIVYVFRHKSLIKCFSTSYKIKIGGIFLSLW